MLLGVANSSDHVEASRLRSTDVFPEVSSDQTFSVIYIEYRNNCLNKQNGL